MPTLPETNATSKHLYVQAGMCWLSGSAKLAVMNLWMNFSGRSSHLILLIWIHKDFNMKNNILNNGLQ